MYTSPSSSGHPRGHYSLSSSTPPTPKLSFNLSCLPAVRVGHVNKPEMGMGRGTWREREGELKNRSKGLFCCVKKLNGVVTSSCKSFQRFVAACCYTKRLQERGRAARTHARTHARPPPPKYTNTLR